MVFPGKSCGPRMLEFRRSTVCEEVTVAVSWAMSTTPSNHMKKTESRLATTGASIAMLAGGDDQGGAPQPLAQAFEIALLKMPAAAPLDEPEHVGHDQHEQS